MEFETKDETAGAMFVVMQWLPELVTRFEAGVKALGLTIEERRAELGPSGEATPILRVRSSRNAPARWSMELHLRNALEDFLTTDRDKSPANLDLQLFDQAYAERKLAQVIEGRLAVVRALAESRSRAEFGQKVKKLAPRYQHLRWWSYDDVTGGKHGRRS